MKKLTLALSVLAALGAGNAMAAEADTKGTVEIRGRVVPVTCKVHTNHKNLIVVLPTVGSNALAGAGQTTGETPFNILVEECNTQSKLASAGVTTVYANFTPPDATYVDSTTGTLKNRIKDIATDTDGITAEKTGYFAAKNVNIQLLNPDKTPIKLVGTTTVSTDPSSSALPDVPGGTLTGTEYNQITPVYVNRSKLSTWKNGESSDQNPSDNVGTGLLGKKVIGKESIFGNSVDAAAGANIKGAALSNDKNTAQMTYFAQYYALGQSEAGDVEAFVTYNIAYK